MISKDSLPILGDERAVSPVIGVALMIGIVVVLGGAIGFAVLDFGDDVGPEPQASADVEQVSDTEYRITWVSEGNADYISFTPEQNITQDGIDGPTWNNQTSLEGADYDDDDDEDVIVLESTGQSVTIDFDGDGVEDDIINIRASIIDTDDSHAVIDSVEDPDS